MKEFFIFTLNLLKLIKLTEKKYKMMIKINHFLSNNFTLILTWTIFDIELELHLQFFIYYFILLIFYGVISFNYSFFSIYFDSSFSVIILSHEQEIGIIDFDE